MNLFRDNNQRTTSNQPLFSPISTQPQPIPSISAPQAQTNSLPQSNALLGMRPTNPQPSTLGTAVQQGANRPQPTLKLGSLNFKQIYRQITVSKKAMTQIQKNPEFRVAMALGLQYFDPSKEKDQQYKKQHSGKQNFGFTTRQMGEECQYFKSDKIDIFWRVLVEYLSEVCDVSELLISQYLREYLVEKPLYLSKLTVKQFYNGSFTRMPNTAFLQTLYVNNYDNRDKSVSVESELFIDIFKQLQMEIYSEQNAMIDIMTFFMSHNKRLFKDVIKKDNCDYFTVMWKKYQRLSVLGRKNELEVNDDKAKKIKQFFTATNKFKISKINTDLRVKVCLRILLQLTVSIHIYGSWRKQPYINSRIDYKQAIKFIDADLEYLDKAQLTSSEYAYILRSIDLLQVVIPMCLLAKAQELRPNFLTVRDAESLLLALRSTKSTHLEFLRFLAWLKLTPVSANRAREVEQQWQKVTDSLQQVLLDSDYGGAWVGLVMEASTTADDLMQCDRLFMLVVSMIKKIVKRNPESFWMEESSDFYYQLIRNCMREYIIDKGVTPWLPVLTKCLGKQTESSLTIRTLDYIGFDGLKREIKENLMQNLDMSDRQASSSVRHSMFMSHHSTNSFMLNASDMQNPGEQVRIFDNYPEHELKLLCRMIKNCKNNLEVVEEKLFECQQIECTGILVCKFLFECLSKLKEKKPSSLKCMRYIISTVNELFANPPTRELVAIAISIVYAQEAGEKAESIRNQLYDMIDYACMSKSQSQLYRQSRKLRQELCNHLCAIVKLSKYLSEYFPLQHEFTAKQEINQVSAAVHDRNYTGLKQWYNESTNTDKGKLRYLSTPYFRTLLLLLQSPQLLPIDFETICTIIRTKLLVSKQWQQEYDLCRLVVDILNGGEILTAIWAALEPTIDNRRKEGSNQPHCMFGLANMKFTEASKARDYLEPANESVREMRFISISSENNPRTTLKRAKRCWRKKEMATGRISGSLQLIGTVLHMHNTLNYHRESFANSSHLILNLKLYTALLSQVSNLSNIYHYRVTMPANKNNEEYYDVRNRRTGLSTDADMLGLRNREDTVLVNFALVVASLVGFENRMEIASCRHVNKARPFRQRQFVSLGLDMGDSQQTAELIKYYSVLNVLDLDQNQLTMQSDYTIGVGNVLYVINQMITLANNKDNNNNNSNNSGVIWRLLSNWDVTAETNIITACSKDFGRFVNQLLNMFEQLVTAEQAECILEFLTLTCCHSPALLFEVLNQKPATLPKLRRSFKQLLQSLQPISDSINHSHKLLVLNKMLLFVLAISEHRHRYPEQVQAFVKLPTNIVQDSLEILPLMQRYLDRISDQQIHSRGSLNPDAELVWEMRNLKQYEFQILYKGTIHACIELYKRFYLNETASQNVQTFTQILLLSPNILTKPSHRQPNLLQHYSIPIRSQLQLTPTVNLLIGSLPVTAYSAMYPSSLVPFLPFMSCLCQQYGRSYQYASSEVSLRSMYQKMISKPDGEKQVMLAYKANYQSSCNMVHELMLTAFFGLLNTICGVGPYGHLLDHDECIIQDNEPSTVIRQKSTRSLGSIMRVLDMYKPRGRYPPPSNRSVSMLMPGSSSQRFQMFHRICTSLINYFESEHSKQSTNDMLLYTICSLLRSMSQCLTPSHGDNEQGRIGQGTTRADVYALKRLTNFVMDSTKIIKIRVTARVFIMLLVQLVKCWQLCDSLGVCCQEEIGKATEIVQAIVAYCGNHIQNQHQIQIRYLDLIFNENNLQDNIFFIALLLTSIIHQQSASIQSSRIYTMRLICSLAELIVGKYLNMPEQECSLTNMAIMKLVHTLITEGWRQMEGKQEGSYDKQEREERIVMFGRITTKYSRFILKAMQKVPQSSVWACWLLDGLTNLLYFSGEVDSGISAAILQFMCTQFEVSKTPSNQSENDFAMSNDKTSLKSRQKHKVSSSSLMYMSSMLGAGQWVPSLAKIAELSSLLYLLAGVTANSSYWTNSKYSIINESIFNSIINQQAVYTLIDAVGSGHESAAYIRYNSADPFMMDRALGCSVLASNFTEANWHRIELEESEDQHWQQPSLSPHSFSANNPMQTSQLPSSKNAKRVTLFEFIIHVQAIDIIYTLSEILSDCLQRSNNLKKFYSKILKTTGKANFIDELVWDKIAGLLLCCLQYTHKKIINFIRFYPRCVRRLVVLYRHCLDSTDMAYSTNFLSSCHLCNPFASSSSSQSSQSPSSTSLIGEYKSYVVDMMLSLAQTCIAFIETWRADDWKSNINWDNSRNSLIQTLNTVFRDCMQYVHMSRDQQQDHKINEISDWIQANLDSKTSKSNKQMDGIVGFQSIRNY